MKRHPNVKIDGLVSVSGFVNSTNGVPDPQVIPFIQAITDPNEDYMATVNGIKGIQQFSVFKPLSYEVGSMFLGAAVEAPLEYRTLLIKFVFSLVDFYKQLNIRALHIIGGEDRNINLAHSLFFASLNKNSIPVIIEGVGHISLWENIKKFNKELIKYASEV